MANWSDTQFYLRGSSKQISQATADLKSSTENNWLTPTPPETLDGNSITTRAGYSSMEILDSEFKSTSITISGSGRWCSPHLYFHDLCTKYNLSGEYYDSESGCGFFHQIKYLNGELLIDQESEFFSDESIARYGIEYFIDWYGWIPDEPDWQDDNPELLAIFAKHGYTIDKLKQDWKLNE